MGNIFMEPVFRCFSNLGYAGIVCKKSKSQVNYAIRV